MIPLILLYLCFITLFLSSLNYEAIITLTASIPLIVYIFNKDSKVEFILRWILYAFVIGLIIYVANLFITDHRFFSFIKRNGYNESTSGILKWNQYFYYHFQYLVYIGITFLALKIKKVTNRLT